jgi:hypothetical protein
LLRGALLVFKLQAKIRYLPLRALVGSLVLMQMTTQCSYFLVLASYLGLKFLSSLLLGDCGGGFSPAAGGLESLELSLKL